MRLRLQPGDLPEQHYVQAPHLVGLMKREALFRFVAGALKGSISESELAMIFPGTARELVEADAAAWFDGGWNHAFWLHVAPPAAASDMHDPFGTIRDRVVKSYLEESPPPARHKLLPVDRMLDSVAVPASSIVADSSFAGSLRTMSERRTRRYFRPGPVSLDALAHVLMGATDRIRENRHREPGACERPRDLLRSYGCWLELGVIVFDVEGLDAGLYRFDIESCQLQKLATGQYRDIIFNLIWKQSAPLTASYSLAMFVDFDQAKWRYRHERALRNIFIELGRIAQDIVYAGQQVGLSSFTTPAIKETEFAGLFGVKPLTLFPAYTVTQGS